MDTADTLRARRLRVTAQNLRVDVVTAEVVGALRDAGVPSILLKGAATIRWLYEPSDARAYVDADLLVPPPQDRAERVLHQLGFAPEAPAVPHDWPDRGRLWMRAADAAQLDLHRGVRGVGADDSKAWDILASHTEPMTIAGAEVATLATPGRALVLALHASHHGAGSPRSVADLERALQRAPLEVWSQGADLAERLDALPAFAAGLRILPQGREYADLLGLPSQFPAYVALRAVAGESSALSFERFAQLESARAKAILVFFKLFPPPAALRRWLASRPGRPRSLALGYVWRLSYVARTAVPGLRAWRTARKTQPRDG